jgi:predicted DNA-binding transcriptional regulator AlpA
VLALIPFPQATLYRKTDAGRFPAAHEMAPRRIAWFKDDVAALPLSNKKGCLRFPFPSLPSIDF